MTAPKRREKEREREGERERERVKEKQEAWFNFLTFKLHKAFLKNNLSQTIMQKNSQEETKQPPCPLPYQEIARLYEIYYSSVGTLNMNIVLSWLQNVE